MVVRMDADSYLFVLVPGDRNISWPLLREHLGVNRVSMPDAEEARSVTGYARGTITPFGATTDWPVIVDSSLAGIVSLGGGAPGVSITATIEDIGRVLEAVSAGVTEAV
jgi:prolyl-tRNA editing enzyme YbaK/EbsC (Cys-tRNA(Pro) deacylase)